MFVLVFIIIVSSWLTGNVVSNLMFADLISEIYYIEGSILISESKGKHFVVRAVCVSFL